MCMIHSCSIQHTSSRHTLPSVPGLPHYLVRFASYFTFWALTLWSSSLLGKLVHGIEVFCWRENLDQRWRGWGSAFLQWINTEPIIKSSVLLPSGTASSQSVLHDHREIRWIVWGYVNQACGQVELLILIAYVNYMEMFGNCRNEWCEYYQGCRRAVTISVLSTLSYFIVTTAVVISSACQPRESPSL